MVQEAQSRLQVVAAVHERLYRSEDFRAVELDIFLETLCRDVERSMLQPDEKIAVEVVAEPVLIGNDRAIPVGLIVNELLMNAVKHAYPDRRGIVEVSLRKLTDGRVWLAIGDAGVGLPADFAERQKHSLGFRIVNGLLRQLRGHVRIVPKDPGVRFELTFEASPT